MEKTNIRRTTRPGYAGTATNLQYFFNAPLPTPKKPYFFPP